MADMISKTFVVETKDVNLETGEVNVFIPMSTTAIDRDGEIVLPSSFKKHLSSFKNRPILVSSHTYGDLRKQIGDLSSIKITDSGFNAKPRYYINKGNAEADWGFFLVTQGVASYSIGFIPVMWEDNPEGDGVKTPRRTYTEIELLEISHVIVPSNRGSAQSIRELAIAKGINPPKEILEVMDTLITKPEETENFIRIPVNECPITATIDISKKEGISALYCGKEKEIATYLFDKRDPFNWTMERARAWVKEHGKEANVVEEKVETPVVKEISQEGIIDEIDYLKQLIAQVGLNTESLKSLKELLERVPGNDIPVEIEIKEEPKPPPLDAKEVAKIVAQTIAQMTGKII